LTEFPNAARRQLVKIAILTPMAFAAIVLLPFLFPTGPGNPNPRSLPLDWSWGTLEAWGIFLLNPALALFGMLRVLGSVPASISVEADRVIGWFPVDRRSHPPRREARVIPFHLVRDVTSTSVPAQRRSSPNDHDLRPPAGALSPPLRVRPARTFLLTKPNAAYVRNAWDVWGMRDGLRLSGLAPPPPPVRPQQRLPHGR
jgi:hypothetical protein